MPTKKIKKNKITVKTKTKTKAKAPKAKTAKSPKAAKKTGKVVTGAAKEFQTKANRLLVKGRERGFVTFDEILKEFPDIEQDISNLDDLYTKLSGAGIDVLEGGGLLEFEPEHAPAKKYSYGSSRGDSSYDSIQMYLKEI